jgi:hypothetical protein
MAPSRIDAEFATGTTSKSQFQNTNDQKTHYGDWRDDFFKDGYVIIKGVLPKDRARQYQIEALTWLESFGIGFDRNDKTTWKKENVPQSFKGGMYLHFSAAHEKYVWDVRWYVDSVIKFSSAF